MSTSVFTQIVLLGKIALRLVLYEKLLLIAQSGYTGYGQKV